MAQGTVSKSTPLQAEGVAAATAIAGSNALDAVRVMVVDDSAVARGLVKNWIGQTDGMDVAGSCSNGLKAVQAVAQIKPDVMILDVEMPMMDGLEALPAILKASPDTRVIMASTLTAANADISLRAMALGAADFIAKPSGALAGTASDDYRRDLLEKVRVLGKAARRRSARHKPASDTGAAGAGKKAGPGRTFALRPEPRSRPKILAVGTSTGGPQALFEVFSRIGADLRQIPILVVQHMPPTFTRILAEKLERVTGLAAHEAIDGEQVVGGNIYVAPGDYHMRVVRKGANNVIALDREPKVHFCRPAVDPMFESVAKTYGAAALAVVLTGMGHDGRKGGEIIADAGGTVYAQDEATSVVWGMPGACAMAGICAGVFPLNEITTAIARRFARSKS